MDNQEIINEGFSIFGRGYRNQRGVAVLATKPPANTRHQVGVRLYYIGTRTMGDGNIKVDGGKCYQR